MWDAPTYVCCLALLFIGGIAIYMFFQILAAISDYDNKQPMEEIAKRIHGNKPGPISDWDYFLARRELEKISEERKPSERNGIYKIGLIIAVAMAIAYSFWPDSVTELPKVPLGPPDTRLLEAYSLLNSSYPEGHPNVQWDWNFGQERSESGHMTRSQILNLSDRMIAYADRLPAYSCCDEKDRYYRCLCEANDSPFMIQVCQETDFDSMTAKEYSMTTGCCDGREGCQ